MKMILSLNNLKGGWFFGWLWVVFLKLKFFILFVKLWFKLDILVYINSRQLRFRFTFSFGVFCAPFALKHQPYTLNTSFPMLSRETTFGVLSISNSLNTSSLSSNNNLMHSMLVCLCSVGLGATFWMLSTSNSFSTNFLLSSVDFVRSTPSPYTKQIEVHYFEVLFTSNLLKHISLSSSSNYFYRSFHFAQLPFYIFFIGCEIEFNFIKTYH